MNPTPASKAASARTNRNIILKHKGSNKNKESKIQTIDSSTRTKVLRR